MIRTQVYLPEELHSHIRLLAKREKKVTAEVIRQLIRKGLVKQKKTPTLGEALLKLAAIAGKGPRDLSTRHDEYYGEA